MYRHTSNNQLEFSDFYLPFNGKLNKNNRWVQFSKLIPWDLIETEYRKSLEGETMGDPALSSRIARGGHKFIRQAASL